MGKNDDLAALNRQRLRYMTARENLTNRIIKLNNLIASLEKDRRVKTPGMIKPPKMKP